MKRIGFLSFGHWSPVEGSRSRTARDALLQSVELAEAAEEIGIGVIDMRYENPLYMAEEAAQADLLSAGRLQLGISRRSPEPALNGAANFGYVPVDGEDSGDMARRHAAVFRHAINGAGVAEPNPRHASGKLPIQPHSRGFSERIWWGAEPTRPPSGLRNRA